MKTHSLKTWPPYFHAIVTGQKTFEVRVNDREFETGDTLQLNEWDPMDLKFTGNTVARRVTFIMDLNDMPGGVFSAIAERVVVMGLSNL